MPVLQLQELNLACLNCLLELCLALEVPKDFLGFWDCQRRLKPRTVKKVAVIGGSLMGSGIATALILGNIKVVLKEVNSDYLQKGIKTIEANVRGLVARKKLAQAQGEKALSLVCGVLDYSQFRDVDMVIEVQ